MFQYWRELARRHRKKIIISTGVIAVTYLVGSYVAKKVNEFQERLKEENFAKEQVKRRFKQTQSDCYMTFLSLLPVLIEPIYEELNVEEITRELQNRRSDKSRVVSSGVAQSEVGLSTVASDDLSSADQQGRSNSNSNNEGAPEEQKKTKTELWNTLKIVSLTRFLTLLYSESLLIIYLHLQLNILSRKSYFETAVKLASQRSAKQGRDSDIIFDAAVSNVVEESTLPEQAFLSFSWWLLNKGWVQIKNVIEDSVEDVFGEINPRQELNIEEFSALINAVQQKIYARLQRLEEPSSPELIVSSLLPPPDLVFFLLQQTNDMEFLSNFNANLANGENLDKLLRELNNYLGNEQVPSILNLLVAVGISKVLDNIFGDMVAKGMASNAQSAEKDEAEEQKSAKVKLASLLASVTKQSNKLTNNSFDNDILYTLNNLQELDDLSASVYSNFDA
ncbi:DEKNAAC102333 [Brettanomyces naardenensis]|uniref:Peroxin-3 n=1 Tax=Brettanomyces naardenensis TaxID=13370 RepID=A0A448YK63_BRENA|nr:DEKNAAC102333 [Brettanomyces naardenensis]